MLSYETIRAIRGRRTTPALRVALERTHDLARVIVPRQSSKALSLELERCPYGVR